MLAPQPRIEFVEGIYYVGRVFDLVPRHDTKTPLRYKVQYPVVGCLDAHVPAENAAEPPGLRLTESFFWLRAVEEVNTQVRRILRS